MRMAVHSTKWWWQAVRVFHQTVVDPCLIEGETERCRANDECAQQIERWNLVACAKLPQKPLQEYNECEVDQQQRPWEKVCEGSVALRAKAEELVMMVDAHAKRNKVEYENSGHKDCNRDHDE